MSLKGHLSLSSHPEPYLDQIQRIRKESFSEYQITLEAAGKSRQSPSGGPEGSGSAGQPWGSRSSPDFYGTGSTTLGRWGSGSERSYTAGRPKACLQQAVTLASLSALSDMHISPGGTKSGHDVRSHLWWLEYAWPMGSDTIRCALLEEEEE